MTFTYLEVSYCINIGTIQPHEKMMMTGKKIFELDPSIQRMRSECKNA